MKKVVQVVLIALFIAASSFRGERCDCDLVKVKWYTTEGQFIKAHVTVRDSVTALCEDLGWKDEYVEVEFYNHK